ncbi:MAG: cupredoxin domain-containing protein [Actinomycetia bacterium]|nr:cupredoxin domain-containing protein [Actinomycetes bacterium]
MFLKKIFKIPLFTMILLLSFALIFLASCKATAPDKIVESAQTDVGKEEVMEKEDDETTKEEIIEEDIGDELEPIDSKPSEDFTDLKGTKEVTINMKNILFDMPNIIIDSGTTVTWVNQDDVGHTVNSDPHPGHSNYPPLNSSLLSRGDTFSLTFDEPGLYTYHCSPHYSTMKGSVLVE